LPLDILQEVGSYAGLAAIIGLSVLSALYFSQARDVKRLREWAGRAPERTGEAAQGGVQTPVVGARPQPEVAPRPPGAAPPAGPRPVPAQASATGAAPASAAGQAAPGGGGEEAEREEAAVAASGGDPAEEGAPAGAGAEPQEEREEAAVAAGEAAPGDDGAPEAGPEEEREEAQDVQADREDVEDEEEAEREEAVAAHGAQSAAARRQGAAAAAGRQGDTQDQPLVPPQAAPVPQAAASAAAGTQSPQALHSGARAGTQSPPRPRPATTPLPASPPSQPGRSPSVPGRGGPRPPVRPGSRAAQTAIIPPPSRAPWYSRLAASPRYLVLVIAGLLIVGGGALFGLSQLSSEESDTGSRGGTAGGAEQAEPGEQPRRPALNPSQVTVAVLNGTTVPGLAAQLGDRIETSGFDLGTVTNSTDQERAESVVLFAPGHHREAVAVGRRLGIGQRERVDAESQGLAGDATVVVIAGIDQTQ
jgi:hypothetical protein